MCSNVWAESKGARVDSGTHAVELAHAVAFRSGLGNSLFAIPYPHINVGDIQAYAGSSFSRRNVAVVGTGISQDTLSRLVRKHLARVPEVQVSTSEATAYYGGENRVLFLDNSPATPHTIFIGFGVPGKPTPELAVLAAYLSPASSIKWSVGTSPLSATLPANTSVQMLLFPYSDAALFGFLVQGQTPEGVTEAGKAAVKALKDAISPNGIKAEDLKKAVAKMKFLAADAVESRDGFIATFGASVSLFCYQAELPTPH